MSRATTVGPKAAGKSDPIQDWIQQCCEAAESAERDATISGLTRDQALELSPRLRIAWFHRRQVWHRELKRVRDDVRELLHPLNEVKIISLIGQTGIGKSSLAVYVLNHLLKTLYGDHAPHEIPLIYVKAPANGERSLSWKVLFTTILRSGREVMRAHQRALNRQSKRTGGPAEKTNKGAETVLEYKFKEKAGLADMREFLASMMRERGVRLLVIDEAFHLLRFADYAATMDTLKSLADETDEGKLMLIGNYDISDLVMHYAQVVRRGEIVHFKGYVWREVVEGDLTDDEKEFKDAVAGLQKLWPCRTIPNLTAVWHELMKASLGSVGLLKLLLLRLAAQQMRSKAETLPTASMLAKSMKSPKARERIISETKAGEEKLRGACYGDSMYNGKSLASMIERMKSSAQASARVEPKTQHV